MKFEYDVHIKESHLDTFGHVNNAVYLQLYEEARWEFITAHGYGLERIQKEQKGPVILEANIKFIKEIKLREKIRITFDVVESRSKLMVIKQAMLKENGDLASELVITIGFFDMLERKLIPMTEEWVRATKIA